MPISSHNLTFFGAKGCFCNESADFFVFWNLLLLYTLDVGFKSFLTPQNWTRKLALLVISKAWRKLDKTRGLTTENSLEAWARPSLRPQGLTGLEARKKAARPITTCLRLQIHFWVLKLKGNGIQFFGHLLTALSWSTNLCETEFWVWGSISQKKYGSTYYVTCYVIYIYIWVYMLLWSRTHFHSQLACTRGFDQDWGMRGTPTGSPRGRSIIKTYIFTQ